MGSRVRGEWRRTQDYPPPWPKLLCPQGLQDGGRGSSAGPCKPSEKESHHCAARACRRSDFHTDTPFLPLCAQALALCSAEAPKACAGLQSWGHGEILVFCLAGGRRVMLIPAADGLSGGGRTMTLGLRKTWTCIPAGPLLSSDLRLPLQETSPEQLLCAVPSVGAGMQTPIGPPWTSGAPSLQM